jgi:Leucine-rich repeat (LRR) protein
MTGHEIVSSKSVKAGLLGWSVSAVLLGAIVLVSSIGDTRNIAHPKAPAMQTRRLQDDTIMAAFEASLPDYTLASLENPDSPQRLALDWLSGHPELDSMKASRMTQLFALVTIYFSLDGPNWTRDALWGPNDLSQWLNHSRPECFWDESSGLACDGEGSLTSLNLDYLESTSTDLSMPAEIGLLSNLIRVSYRVEMDMTLEDLLPAQHFTLPKLEMMSLTPVGGTLSSQIGLLSDLNSLDIYHRATDQRSNTYGPLPTELGLLTNMNDIMLLNAAFPGAFISELGKLTNLYRISIAGSSLEGTVPTEFGRITTLTKIQLANNKGISGNLPSELGLLVNLTEIDIRGNALGGPIPTEFVGLANVWNLDLSQNQFSSALPSELGLATQLRQVNVGGNQLEGRLPSEIALPLLLVDLNVADNDFVGGLPSELGLLQELQRFNVSHNKITELPSEIGRLANIEAFDGSHNAMAGELPTEISLMGATLHTKMWSLDLSHNAIIGELPSEIGLMSRLTHLDLRSNGIGGALPTQLGLLAHMLELHLASNSFDSPIPTEIGLMRSLKTLDMSKLLSLAGPIPSEMGLMTSLLDLDLSSNPSMTGTVPRELSDLVLTHDLQNMNVTGNFMLNGAVPNGLCQLNIDRTNCVYRGSCSFSFDCGRLCGCGSCFCDTVNVGRQGDTLP